MTLNYYDKDGSVIDQARWIELFEDHEEYRRIGLTEVGASKVSTVWLGLDHQYGDGPPVIFETLIVGGPHDGEMYRYSTLAEAESGHERIVVWLREVQ